MGENTQLGPRPPSLYSIIKPNMAISLMTCVSADVAIIWMTHRLSIVPPGCRTHGGWWVWPLLTGFQSKNTGSTSLSPRAIWNHFTARVPHRCLDSLRVRLNSQTEREAAVGRLGTWDYKDVTDGLNARWEKSSSLLSFRWRVFPSSPVVFWWEGPKNLQAAQPIRNKQSNVLRCQRGLGYN